MSDGIGQVAYGTGADAPVIYYEYLDAVRFGDAAQRHRVSASLREKFQDRQLDLVIAVAPDAIAFADDQRDALWPDTPLLFVSYTTQVPDAVVARRGLSAGLSFDWGFPQAIDVMKAVFPDTTKVALVAGGSDIERVRQNRNAEALRRAGLDAVSLESEPLASTLATISRLADHSLVFIAGGQVDANDSVVPTWALCEAVSKAANRPTIMLGSQFLGCGIVGGLMRDYHKVGTVIGERAMALIGGRSTVNETVPFVAVSKLAFDARQLARWKVADSQLPAGSTIEFRQPSPWREYRGEILVGLAGLIVQSALIFALLYQRRERAKAEAESRRNLSLAADADRRTAMAALTGSIAHELSQPLGSILHNAEAAEKMVSRGHPSEDLRELLRDIRQEESRAAEIIQKHRTMLKHHELERQTLDIYAVVRDAVALVAHTAREQRVAIEARPPVVLCLVTGDRVLLQQVVVNLVLNAIDAMRDTPPTRRRVTIGVSTNNGEVDVSVRDAGTGLASDIDRRVFEPFVTTKRDGLGLGLSIVRSIVEAHGGRIEGRSNAEGGATFRVFLPRKADSAAKPIAV